MTDTLTIITNNVPRPIVDASELPLSAHAQFDYLNWPAIERGEESASFIHYKGWWYDLSDTEGIFPPDTRWLFVSDSFFSGVLFRFTDDFESIVCGRYYS